MRSILILDDDDAVRQSIVDFFEDSQWQTLPAVSAEEALHLLEEKTPEAAIVDIRLPKMNGYDFIRAASKAHQTMVLTICTGSPEFYMPDDLKPLARLSQIIFRKPVKNMKAMEEEVIRLIETSHVN